MDIRFSLRQYYLVQVLRVLSQPFGTPKVAVKVRALYRDANYLQNISTQAHQSIVKIYN